MLGRLLLVSCLLLVPSILALNSTTINSHVFITNYFQHYEVSYLTLLICNEKTDNYKMFKYLPTYQMNIFAPKFIINNGWALTMLLNAPYSKIGIVLDYSCVMSSKILEMASYLRQFRAKFFWLIFDIDFEESAAINQMKTLNVSVNAEIKLAFADDPFGYKLYDVFNPGYEQGGKLNVTEFAYWDANGHILIIYSTQTKYERRIDLRNVTIRAASVRIHNGTQPLVEYLRDTRDRYHDSFAKFAYALFSHLTDLNKFWVNLSCADRWFGFDGAEPAGLQKLIMDEEIDVSATFGLRKADRLHMMDFYLDTWPFRACFIFQNPETSGLASNMFLTPFTNSTWYGLVGLTAVVIVVTRLMLWADRNLHFFNRTDGWSAATLLTMGAFCQQGTSIDPTKTSARFALFVVFASSMLSYNYYTSSVVSSLLNAQPPRLTTIEELARSTLSVIFEDVIYTKILFKVSPRPEVQLLYKNKVAPSVINYNPYIPLAEGVALVKSGGYAYHTEPQAMYPLIEQSFEPEQICQLSEINLFPPTRLSLLAQKNSPYSKHFAIGVRRMYETGLADREMKMWYARKPECMGSTMVVSVGIGQIFPALIALAIGMLVALIFLLIELGRGGRHAAMIHKKFIKRKPKSIIHN